MSKVEFKKEIEKYNKIYTELKDEINQFKANGSLSKLCNLNTEFDETFDQFFTKELAEKYIDDELLEIYIDNEQLYAREKEELINDNMCRDIMLDKLDESDELDFIQFYKNYIDELEDELNSLKLDRGDDN